jgi:putative nucleotidyltransferase with HDIG domain
MDTSSWEIQHLLSVIVSVAAGNYSNDILALTTETTPEPIRTIAEAMGLMMVKVEAREFRLEMLIEELRRANEEIKANSLKTVAAMAQALEARDAYTRGHAERVSALAAAIATEMGLEDETVELVRKGGVLHDIGKIGCSDRIFQPHGVKNSPDVVKEIVDHPAVGAEILKNLDFLGDVTELIHAHHERIDGKGYPRGLKGSGIPLGSRIIAVADTYDAITTDRPYQKARSHETALEILREHAGTHWDPECVAAFERLPKPGTGTQNAPAQP